MPTLVATAGASNANSYLSVAGADSIADGMVGTLAWTTATETNKIKALITATNGLETLGWVGERANETQALSWPRRHASCGDKTIADDDIPRELELATFDLANALLGDPTLLKSAPSNAALVEGIPNRDLRRVRLDVLEIEWNTNVGNSTTESVTPLTVLPHLASILGCLTTSTTRGGLGGTLALQRS